MITCANVSKYIIRQGDLVASLSEVNYQPAEGFIQDNVDYVAEEFIEAESSIELSDGPATLVHGGREFHVIVSKLLIEAADADETEGDLNLIELRIDGERSELAASLGLK